MALFAYKVLSLCSLCIIHMFLHLMPVGLAAATSGASLEHGPHIVPLRREAVPVRRQGRVVSSKTSYSGKIHVGTPPQEFRVVFDTGSGHVMLPAASCESASCHEHRRYNASTSSTSTPVDADGSEVPEGELCDQVTIGFGTGEITGEFVRERVCIGGATEAESGLCAGVHVVQAVEMSDQPFRNFAFDGILGLGLAKLALAGDFSFFEWLSAGKALPAAQFAFFLTDGQEQGEESEMAVGGHNPARILGPLMWTPVVMPELGYWQVEILSVRLGGKELELCRRGGCHGIVDTGASHLGVPSATEQEFARLLTAAAPDSLSDCREVDAPLLEIELSGQTLTLGPGHYMRPMPLDRGVTLDSPEVHLGGDSAEADSQRHCRPRTMPMKLPKPLGPKLFVFGEPVLHRYYTAFDWKERKVGFALADTRRNARSSGQQALRPQAATSKPGGKAPAETVDYLLLQQQSAQRHRKK